MGDRFPPERVIVFTGMRNVCVQQTALRALEQGYEVFVVRDAVGANAAEEYEAGLARMRGAGVEIVTIQMAMFEILAQAGTPDFKKVLHLLKS